MKKIGKHTEAQILQERQKKKKDMLRKVEEFKRNSKACPRRRRRGGGGILAESPPPLSTPTVWRGRCVLAGDGTKRSPSLPVSVTGDILPFTSALSSAHKPISLPPASDPFCCGHRGICWECPSYNHVPVDPRRPAPLTRARHLRRRSQSPRFLIKIHVSQSP